MLRTTRIFLADDHVLVRQGLRSLLEMEEDIVIVGEASNGADAVEKVGNGHPGTAMAAFRDQLNDVEIAAVITYTRNAWADAGKGADPVVQPADVTAQR